LTLKNNVYFGSMPYTILFKSLTLWNDSYTHQGCIYYQKMK